MATELTQGISQGEDLPQLRRRLQPLADGLAWKAQRIARTEASRVQERATLEATRRMGGELLAAFQVVAVLDQNTRPHHAARHGRLYRQGPDGEYRSSQGELLPDLPDEPNCRCMAVPVLRPPKKIAPEFWQQADQEWEKAQAQGLVPDVDDMAQWWQKAGTKQRQQAVGAQRYRRMKELLGREPDWEDFIDPQGNLMSLADLLAEEPQQRVRRRAELQKQLLRQRVAYQQVSRLGFLEPGAEEPEPTRRRKKRKHRKKNPQQGRQKPQQKKPSPPVRKRSRPPDPLEHPRAKQALEQLASISRLTQREKKLRETYARSGRPVEQAAREIQRRTAYYRRRKKRLEKLSQQAEKLPDEVRAALLKRLEQVNLELERAQREAILDAIRHPNAGRNVLKVKQLPRQFRSDLEDAARFVEALIDQDLARAIPELELVDEPMDPNMSHRPHYAQDKVYLTQTSRVADAVHEIVHHVESYVPGAKQKLQEFYARATRGALPKRLQGEDYTDEEYYKERTDGGQWIRDYQGKVYSTGTTEVATITLEELYEDPERVAKHYPELLAATLKALRGVP